MQHFSGNLRLYGYDPHAGRSVNPSDMLKTYLVIAIRNLKKNKIFSFINILGLAIGLTCCLLIAAYVRDETGYDRYPAKAGNIYRVDLGLQGNTNAAHYPSVDVAVGPGIKANYPEVLEYTRLVRQDGLFVQYGLKQFKEQKLALADSNFFHVFTIPFLEGDARTALTQPHSIVVTKAFAGKYFGTEAAMGKTLSMGRDSICTVTGVIDKIPDNAHFHFDAFISLSSLHIREQTWSNLGMYTYLVLDDKADPKKLEAQFPQLVAKYVVPEIQRDMGTSLAEAQKSIKTFLFHLMPLTDIHLYSDTKYELEANGDHQYVVIFSALALFILLLACANFTNLSTATATRRGKEVGLRKVMGSLRSQLVGQFLAESVLLTFFALLLAIGLVFVLLPYFNEVSGKHIPFRLFIGLKTLAGSVVLVLLVGIMAGLYPAVFLSSFNTIKVLKGASPGSEGRKSLLRSGLVVFQFFVSITLIVATMVVYRQLHYMQDKRLGYDKEQVVCLQDTWLLGNNEEAFRLQLLQDKRVTNASISWSVPGSGQMNGTEVYAKNDNGDNGKQIHTNIFNIDYTFIPTLGMHVVQGRNFDRGFATDTLGVVINQAAVEDLGWGKTDPLGKTIVRSGQKAFKVIGVVEDFHYASVKQRIAPLMLLLGRNSGAMLVKIKTGDVAGFLNVVKSQWAAFHPAGPLGYYFLDDQFATLYAAEQKTGSLFTAFTSIAIIIAGLGLFGLSAYTAQLRMREIGIRKVLGATVTQVLLLVSKEFLYLVGLAFLIATPVTWWAMSRWLEDFAYRTSFPWWIFPVAGGAALLIAVLTVSLQTVKAALTSPVKSLKSE
jgi:putative ABC transport system permease protein